MRTLWAALASMTVLSPAALADQRDLLARYRAGEVTEAVELAFVAGELVELGREDPRRFHEALRVYDEAVAADPANLDIQVALGDLFLAKYNATDARETYEKVLARDPDHPRALLGLARVRRFDGATDVSDLVDRSLEADPDQAAPHLLLARQFLDYEDYDAADREIGRALAKDPLWPEAHALAAASVLLRGDERGHGERLARLAEIAPDDPEPFVTLAEIAARNRLYARAVELAGRAVEIDALAWRGWALRGVNRLRTGDVAGGRRDLETAFAGDPFDVWTKNTLDLLDAMAGYRTIATPRFELVMPAADAELLALYLAPLAEEAYDRLAARYGVELATPVRLEVFPRHADFSVRTIGLVGLGALGVSFGPVIAMDAPTARPAGDFHWGATLWHELAHSFHLALSGHRVPRWFTEGLAVYEERQARPGWGDGVTPEFLIAYKQDRLAPVDDLNRGFMRPEYPRQIVFSYYQASLVFDDVVERWGFPAVVAMLAAYGDGRGTSEVFADVLGVDLAAFAKAFDASFRERFAGPLAALVPTDDEGDVRARADGDPGDFLAQLAAGRALMEADPEAARPYLERAKALFPEAAGADSPRWWLARIHRRAGRLEAAAAELTALTELNAAHYPALRALAEIADAEAAAAALENAQYVFPYEEDDHRRLAERFEAAERWPQAVRERRAVLALEPFNRSQAFYRLARAQRAAGDRKAARSSVLAALELAPNYEEALTLLLELRDERGES